MFVFHYIFFFFSSRRRHTRSKRDWSSDVCSSDLENKEVDFFVIKGVLEELFRYLNKQVSFEQAVLPDMHPGRCATINIDGNTIGFLGQVHPSYAKSIDLKATYIFDLNLEY